MSLVTAKMRMFSWWGTSALLFALVYDIQAWRCSCRLHGSVARKAPLQTSRRHIMRDQRCIIAVHRAWRVKERGKQVLPDIPNLRGVLPQAVRDKADVFAVQLQEFRPHNLGRIIISADTDTVTGAANRFQYQIDNLIELLPVNLRIVCQNVVVDVSRINSR